MPTFDEYINSLEGKAELNPLDIARDLRNIYAEEIGIRDAKIDELTGTIAEKDGAITVAATELQAQKAKNFDLAMQIPGTSNSADNDNSDEEIDGGTLTIDDLFVK